MVASNSIGSFAIGQSAIGDLVTENIYTTVISQYANSPILMAFVQNFVSYFDQTQNIDNFFDMVFDVATAQGAGLAAIGRIVGVTNLVPIVSNATFTPFGFSQQLSGNNVGNFSNSTWSGYNLTTTFQVSDAAFRVMILAKAALNLTDCSIPNINKILQLLFPNRGACYVVDNGNMTMDYVFNFSTTPVEKSIIANSGVLPRPSGVAVTYSY